MARRKKVRKYKKRKKGIIHKFLRLVFATLAICALLVSILLLLGFLSNGNFDKSRENLSTLIDKNIKKDLRENADFLFSKTKNIAEKNEDIYQGEGSSDSYDEDVLFVVAVVADMHENIENLGKVIEYCTQNEIDNLFVIGDLTNYGDIKSLRVAKNILDSSGLNYFAISGDRDLGQSSSHANFLYVFEERHHLLNIEGYTLIAFDNSANFTPIPSEEITWFNQQLPGADFVFLSQPLYTGCLGFPFNKTYMGSTWKDLEDERMIGLQEVVNSQGMSLLEVIRNYNNVKALISGDHHRFSLCQDTKKPTLYHYNIGSVTDILVSGEYEIEVNPSFALLKVFNDGVYKIESILIN